MGDLLYSPGQPVTVGGKPGTVVSCKGGCVTVEFEDGKRAELPITAMG